MALEVPTSLSPRQRELLEAYAKETGEDVLPQQKSFMDKLKELFD